MAVNKNNTLTDCEGKYRMFSYLQDSFHSPLHCVRDIAHTCYDNIGFKPKGSVLGMASMYWILD